MKCKELKISNFYHFISTKETRLVIILISFILFFTYGQRLFSNGFSIDTEIFINNPDSIYATLYSLGRPSLVLIDKVLGVSELVPFINIFTTLVLIVVQVILINFLLYKNVGDRYKQVLLKFEFILPIIFLTSAIFAEQYTFIFQSIGVALGITLIPIVILLTGNAVENDYSLKNFLYILFAIILLTFAFGIYQSIVPLFVLVFVATYFTKICFSETKNNYFKYLLANVVVFVVSFLLYNIISRFLAIQSSYLQFCWMKQDFSICTRNIYYVARELLTSDGIFYNLGYPISLIFMGLLFVSLITMRRVNLGLIISTLALIISPLYLMIATGTDQLYRTQFNYPFFVGFVFLVFTIFAYTRKANLWRLLMFISIFFSFVISYRQADLSAKLFYSDAVRYQNDVHFGEKLEYRIESNSWFDKDKVYTLIFVGAFTNKPSTFIEKGEVMGYSFFEFDYPYIYGPSQRGNMLMRTLGYVYNFPSVDQFNSAKAMVVEKGIPSWPSNDSIFNYDDVIIVRLSEEID